jgi:hypothetical protein
MNIVCRFSGIVLIITMLLIGTSTYPWGFYGHKMITRNAIYILPQDILAFYKTNITDIVEASIQPDIRRYVYEDEAPRHYIDLELFGSYEDSILYINWNQAVEIFSEDSLNAKGILPWAIILTYFDLVDAFKNKDPQKIVSYSADLSHYISDAHVPLHTTYNYNGQFTGQVGIHRLWESLIPERHAEKYTFWVGRAEYLENVYSEVRRMIMESHQNVNSVLELESTLTKAMDPDKKYSFQRRGNQEVRLYSQEFVDHYNRLLDRMVEKRMQDAVKMTASFWYTSWVEAGQPDLSGLELFDIKPTKRISGQSDSTTIRDRSDLHH